MIDPNKVPSEEDAKKTADEIKAEQNKEDADFLAQLDTPAGRRVWYRVIDHAETMREPFVAQMSDMTAYNLGKQSEGRYWLTQILRLAPDKYFQMCREAKSAMTVKKIIKENKED